MKRTKTKAVCITFAKIKLQIPTPPTSIAVADIAYVAEPNRSGITRRRKSNAFSITAWGTFDTVVTAKTMLATSMTL